MQHDDAHEQPDDVHTAATKAKSKKKKHMKAANGAATAEAHDHEAVVANGEATPEDSVPPTQHQAEPAAAAIKEEEAAPAAASQPVQAPPAAEPVPAMQAHASMAADEPVGTAASPAQAQTSAPDEPVPRSPAASAASHAATDTAAAAPSPMPNPPEQHNLTGDEILATPSAGKVQELMRKLSSPTPSSASLAVPAPPAKISSLLAADAAGATASPAAASSATTPVSARAHYHRQVSATRRTTGSIPAVVSTHDKENTVNAFQLLKLGAFKLQAGVDFVAYDELIKLRLEDGIDPTRREDYLSDEDFVKVFGMDREAFRGMPAWKKQQKKKQVNLF